MVYIFKKNHFFYKKNYLYSDQEALRNKLKVAFTDKAEAYDELNECKDNIDSWYAKSDRTPWLLGNGGKKIPSHSMFGQSFGDLDSYKYARDQAYSNVESCKDEIGDLKSEIDHNKRNIDQVKQDIINLNLNIQQCKDDRKRMYDLKKDGITKENTQIEIDKLRVVLKIKQAELDTQEREEKSFIFKKKQETGVIGLEGKIKVIVINKSKFITEFDSSENNLIRVNEHRASWFKKINNLKL